MKNHFTLLICFFLFLGWNQNLNAQCENDVEAPVLVTITGFTATLETTGTIEVFATDLVVSLSDNCTENPELFLSVESIPAGSSFVFTSPGTYVVSLQATDEQGNVTVNTLNVIIEGTGQAGCDPDEEAPNIWCINDLEIELSPSTGVATLNVDNLVANTSDNCSSSVDVYMTFPGAPMVDTYEFAALGNYPVTVTVQDLAGNSTFCTTFVAVVEDTGAGPCQGDLEPPVPICINGVEAALSEETGNVEIWTSDLIASLSDNCSSANDIDLALSVEGVSVMGESFTFVEPGIYVVAIYATDEAGNTTSCETYVIITGGGSGCDPDVEAPNIFCINDLEIELSSATGVATLNVDNLVANTSDNCSGSVDVYMTFPDAPMVDSYEFTALGNYPVTVTVADLAGNTNFCLTTVAVVEEDPNGPCQSDEEAPTLDCVYSHLVVILPPSGNRQLWAVDLVENIGDNCSLTSAIDLSISLVGSGDTTESVMLTEAGFYDAEIFATDEAGNIGHCTMEFEVGAPLYNKVQGNVFNDFNNDCIMGAGEMSLSGWPVTIRQSAAVNGDTTLYTYTVNADENGDYEAYFDENVTENNLLWIEVALEANNEGGSCPNSFIFGPEVFADTNQVTYDLPLHLLENCYALNVDITAPILRRCFSSNYFVSVCNTGTEQAENASVLVVLDELLDFISSTIPVTSSAGQLYTFDIGGVDPGECVQFKIEVEVSCEALLGQTHCSGAFVTPVSPCNIQEMPQLSIEGECVGDEVVFRITNNSSVDMQEYASYQVVEDVIMYLQDSVRLNGNEWEEVVLPANGSTYYLELEDPDPGSLELEGLAVEACGTNANGGVSLGFVTSFPFNSPIPEVDVDCQENIGSFDPNDKQAWPLGVGEDHRIRPGTNLEYMIRFQNTGTDTAFNIVIKDTLSPYLNLATVKAGAASHDYRFNVLEGNVLQFSFDNIALPDSNVNAAASQGFVKFSVQQMPDNPIGTEILNQAAIYFDFNEPIITNAVSRLVSEEVIVVSVDDPQGPTSLPTSVFPNPFSALTTIQVSGLKGQRGELLLFDVSGKHLTTQILENGQAQLSAANLKAGLYFFSIQAAGQTVSRGKVVVR